MALIREHLDVKPFDENAKNLLAYTVRAASRIREDIADILNFAIEELVRQRYELPGITTLLAKAQRGRSEVNQAIYSSVVKLLGIGGCRAIDDVLEDKKSLWHALKLDPGALTLTQLRRLLHRLKWLTSLNLTGSELFATVPPVKVAHFHQTQAGQMITLLHRLLMVWREPAGAEQRLTAIEELLGDQTDQLIAQCQTYTASANHGYLPFLWPFCQSHRRRPIA